MIEKRQAIVSVDHSRITDQKEYWHAYQIVTDKSEHYCHRRCRAVSGILYGQGKGLAERSSDPAPHHTHFVV